MKSSSWYRKYKQIQKLKMTVGTYNCKCQSRDCSIVMLIVKQKEDGDQMLL